LLDEEPPRHAEMDDADIAGFELDQEILGAPADIVDAPPLEPPAEIARERNAQILPPELDAGDALAFQRRRQAAADGFDFGQLGHGAKVTGRRGDGEKR